MNIYSYDDPIEFLKQYFELKKEKNSSFSLRAWAMQLGLKSHSSLHAVLRGQRKIPKELIPSLLKSLKLEKKEQRYFETLIELHRAKTVETKRLYREKLIELSPEKLRNYEDIENYKAITDPLHFMICELSQLKNFSPNLGWIKNHLRINANLKDIEDAFTRLQKLRILKFKDGKYIKEINHLYTKYEISSESVKECHRYFSNLAIDQLSHQDLKDREYNTVSFNINKSDIPLIKERMRMFVNQIIKDFEKPSHEGEETYHLNTQFFSLSK